MWAAKVMAYLAYPKRAWNSVLQNFLEETLLQELKDNPSSHFNAKRMPKGTPIVSVSVVITQTERLKGRRAFIRGMMTLDYGTDRRRKFARSGGTHQRMIEVTLGPDEFRVE